MSHMVGTVGKLSSTYSDRESLDRLDRSSIHTRSYGGREGGKERERERENGHRLKGFYAKSFNISRLGFHNVKNFISIL